MLSLKEKLRGAVLACLIGFVGVGIRSFSQNPVFDPLFVSLLLGIVSTVFIKRGGFRRELPVIWNLFIPAGIILYGAVNLDFHSFYHVRTGSIFLISIVMLVYLLTVLSLCSLFRLSEKTSYLIASGSTICGASAIAITSRSIEAEPDEISMSLVAVFLAALCGLFVVLPLARSAFSMSEYDYATFAGSTVQFTGFVKTAVANLQSDSRSTAMSFKTMRYVGLLFIIPLFTSLTRGRVSIPWYLGAFLGAGIIFSIFHEQAEAIKPFLKQMLSLLWSIAMAAVGMSADLKQILTWQGVKAFAASLLSFLIAGGIFILGHQLLK